MPRDHLGTADEEDFIDEAFDQHIAEAECRRHRVVAPVAYQRS